MSGHQTLLDRMLLLVAANVNALLTRAEQSNSVGLLDEHINRLREAHGELLAAEGVERGHARDFVRRVESTRAQASKYDSEINQLLVRGERALAATLQARLNATTRGLDQLLSGLAECHAETGRLGDARFRIAGQIELAQAARQQLVALLARKRAAEARLRATALAGRFDALEALGEGPIERVRMELDVLAGRQEVEADRQPDRLESALVMDAIDRQLRERELRLLPEVGTQRPIVPMVGADGEEVHDGHY